MLYTLGLGQIKSVKTYKLPSNKKKQERNRCKVHGWCQKEDNNTELDNKPWHHYPDMTTIVHYKINTDGLHTQIKGQLEKGITVHDTIQEAKWALATWYIIIYIRSFVVTFSAVGYQLCHARLMLQNLGNRRIICQLKVQNCYCCYSRPLVLGNIQVTILLLIFFIQSLGLGNRWNEFCFIVCLFIWADYVCLLCR